MIHALVLALLLIVILADGPARAGDLSWCDKGDALMDEDRFRRAEKLYDLCIATDDLTDHELALAHHRRGRAFMKQEQLEDALAAIDQALDADPTYHPAWNTRAWIGLLKNDLIVALDDSRRGIDFSEDNVRVLDTYAHILAALGRHEEAMTAFNRVLALYGPEGIAKYQGALEESGYDPGPADGIAGPATRGALEQCVADACILW